MKHVVIIGNGISGVTAARHLRKKTDHRITIISGETDHFFSRTALMYIYMGHMKYEHTKPYEDHFWAKNKIELCRDWVEKIDFTTRTLSLKGKGAMVYDELILAVGSKPNKFGWPGQDLPGVQGLYSFQDLELLEENTHGPFVKGDKRKVKRAVIVGGGLIGVELAEMLLTRNIEVTFLVREDRFWGNVLPKEEGEIVARHMQEHHIDLRLKTELKEIKQGPDGRANAVITSSGEEINCELVGLTAGVGPNVDFLKDSNLEIQRGIMVNRYLETNQPNVHAIGDCAQFHEAAPRRRAMEQVWYTGRMMGERVAKNIAGDRGMYAPGHWFNSAKFFDIEYQTYGMVLANPQEGETTFYWEEQKGKMSLRLVSDSASKQFKGMNVFGIRMRHEVVDRWLREERSVEYVVSHLKDANFDPEFYKSFENEIVGAYNREFGANLKVEKKSWSRILNLSK